MSIPFASSSSRVELREFLAFAGRILDKYGDLDSVRERTPLIDFAAASTRINELGRRYQEPFRLAIVGEFKAGKSALINALIGRRGLVPEGVTPTTGALTEIWWSENEHGEVLDHDGKQIFTGTLEGAVRYADQRSREGQAISGKGARVVLHVESDFLRNLVILDTPGLGANARDDKVTLGSLDLADAAILVVNGLQPGGEDSISLAERLRTAKRKLLTVVTRIDLAGNAADALDAAREVFGSVSEGEPIGVASPAIVEALDLLKRADEKSDQEGVAAANERLRTTGYLALRERLQEEFFAGGAVEERASRVVADLRTLLHRLEAEAALESGLSQKKADAIASELSAAQRYINDVLRPRLIFLDSKIDEIVDKHSAEFIEELGVAMDVFIDRIFDGGISLGFRSIMAQFSKAKENELRDKLRGDFRELFPDDQQEIFIAHVTRAVRTLMEMEWQEMAAEAGAQGSASQFDPGNVVMQICDHIAQLSAALVVEIVATIALIFVPGGVIYEIVAMILSLGGGSYVVGKQSSRMHRIKRETRVRLVAKRRELAHRLSEQFRDVNSQTKDEVVARLTEGASEKDRLRTGLLGIAQRWRQAQEEVQRLIDDCHAMSPGASA